MLRSIWIKMSTPQDSNLPYRYSSALIRFNDEERYNEEITYSNIKIKNKLI